jgi:SAM-dependent methyltransferase
MRMTPDERWLSTLWPFVRENLPAPPARVVEIGCGRLGGFVPLLREAGYSALGIDPEAPEDAAYLRMEFERYEPSVPAAAIVACTSLHHVADVGEVLDLAGAALAPGGRMLVVEWGHERFDETTARWCFARLPAAEDAGDHHGWLARLRDQWHESGRPWDEYIRSWAQEEGLHPGEDIRRQLAARFGAGTVSYGPYYFADLSSTGEADEQAAIDAGQIQPGRIQYVGRLR